MIKVETLLREYFEARDSFSMRAFFEYYKFRNDSSLSVDELFNQLGIEEEGKLSFVENNGELCFHNVDTTPTSNEVIYLSKKEVNNELIKQITSK